MNVYDTEYVEDLIKVAAQMAGVLHVLEYNIDSRSFVLGSQDKADIEKACIAYRKHCIRWEND